MSEPAVTRVSTVPEFSIEPWPPASRTLVAGWAELVRVSALNPTLGPEWFSVIAESLARPGHPLSMLVRRASDGSVSGVLPFLSGFRRMLGLRLAVLEPGSNLMSYHAEVVASGATCEMLAELLRSAPRWDLFHIANVPLESRTAAAVVEVARQLNSLLQVIEGDASPYLPIKSSWADSLAARSKKFRYKLRHRRQLIEAHGGCTLQWITSESEVDQLLREMLIVEEHSWKSGAGLDIAARKSELAYHGRLLPYLARERALLANVLYHGSRPIAYSLCCSFGGWVGHLKTSFDEEFSALSPGGFLIDACIEKAFSIEALEFDFLGDAAPHKLAWTSCTRRHADFFVFAPTLKGRLVGSLKSWKKRLRGMRRNAGG